MPAHTPLRLKKVAKRQVLAVIQPDTRLYKLYFLLCTNGVVRLQAKTLPFFWWRILRTTSGKSRRYRLWHKLCTTQPNGVHRIPLVEQVMHHPTEVCTPDPSGGTPRATGEGATAMNPHHFTARRPSHRQRRKITMHHRWTTFRRNTSMRMTPAKSEVCCANTRACGMAR